jgi:hypothetical protein
VQRYCSKYFLWQNLTFGATHNRRIFFFEHAARPVVLLATLPPILEKSGSMKEFLLKD